MPRLKYRIHADDYAVSKHAAEQIIELIEAGKITSVSYMVNMPDSVVCLQILEPYRKHIKIALHLNIFEGYCCTKKEEIPHLVYTNGTFRTNWVMLIWKMIFPTYKSEVKKELKSQINRYYELMGEGKDNPIRIDSHQHFHMIPLVFKCLCQVIDENQFNVEYIRMSKEPLWPFIKSLSLYPTYRVINLLKNIICNIFSIANCRVLKHKNIQTSTFLGLMYSDHMDAHCIYKILKNRD